MLQSDERPKAAAISCMVGISVTLVLATLDAFGLMTGNVGYDAGLVLLFDAFPAVAFWYSWQLYSKGSHRKRVGALSLLVAAIYFIPTFAGFVVGFVFLLVGGIGVFGWKPRSTDLEPPSQDDSSEN